MSLQVGEEGQPGKSRPDEDTTSPRGILTNGHRDANSDAAVYRKLVITARMPSMLMDEAASNYDDNEDKISNKSGKSVRFSLPSDVSEISLPSKCAQVIPPPHDIHLKQPYELVAKDANTSLPILVRKTRQAQRFDRPKIDTTDDPFSIDATIDKVLEANRPATVHGSRSGFAPGPPPYSSHMRGARTGSGKVLSRRYTYVRSPMSSARQRLHHIASSYSQASSVNSPNKEVLKTKSFQIHSPGKPLPKPLSNVRASSSASPREKKTSPATVTDFRRNIDFMELYHQTINDMYTIKFPNSDPPEMDPYRTVRNDYYPGDKNDSSILRLPQQTIPTFKEINGMLHGVPKRLHCREASEYNLQI